MSLSSLLPLACFLLLSFLVATSGAIFKPGVWYENLRKPSWTPPNFVFPIVWSILYVAIAVSGWLVWREVGLALIPFGIFAVQLILNFLWSALFFGRRRPDLAFLDVVLLWLAIGANILAFWSVSPIAGALLLPYLLWVTIAATLNLSVWKLNRGHDAFA